LAANNDFLDHDSYVELLEVHEFSESELRSALEIGQMSADEMKALSRSAVRCATLTPEQKEIIDNNLARPLGRR